MLLAALENFVIDRGQVCLKKSAAAHFCWGVVTACKVCGSRTYEQPLTICVGRNPCNHGRFVIGSLT
jgi:hypothetical protein